METAVAIPSQGSIKHHFCRGMESHMHRGELTLASHRILTEQSIFIKESEQFQSIFWNHIIRGNIWLHLNIYRGCTYVGGIRRGVRIL